MRKLIWSLLVVLALGSTYLGYTFQHIPHENERSADPDHCPFCRQEVIDSHGFYEGEAVYALLNYQPLLRGHSMVIPKRHVGKYEDLTDAERAEIAHTVRKVGAAFKHAYGSTDYFVAMQNGFEAGQTVQHCHMHVIPRDDARYWAKFRLWTHFVQIITATKKSMSTQELRREADILELTMAD